MRLPIVVGRRGAETQTRPGRRRTKRGGRLGGLCVGVLWGRGVMRTATKQLVAVRDRLLLSRQRFRVSDPACCAGHSPLPLSPCGAGRNAVDSRRALIGNSSRAQRPFLASRGSVPSSITRSSRRWFGRGRRGRRRFALRSCQSLFYRLGSLYAFGLPCKAAEDVAGDWEKVSRSRRIAEDCFRAELKREFWKVGRQVVL